MGWTLISAVPGGTRTVPAWNPTVETVGYCLSPAGLGKGSRSVINRANGCGTGHGQAEFSAVPGGTRTAAARPPTVETVGYFLSPAGLGKGGRSVINRANGCGTGHGQAEFSTVPDGTRSKPLR